MGKECYCDFCRKTVPEGGLEPISVGKSVIGDACLTCGSSIKNMLSKTIADKNAEYMAAMKIPIEPTPAERPQGTEPTANVPPPPPAPVKPADVVPPPVPPPQA